MQILYLYMSSVFNRVAARFGQSASKHGRRTFLYSEMRELVCKGQLLARVALSLRQLRRTARVSYSNSFSENPGNDCCYSIYFDISTIVWLSRLL